MFNRHHFYQSAPYFIKCLIASYQGYRLRRRRTHGREDYLKHFAEKDEWSIGRLKEEQSKRLNWILKHARETVPFYRETWDSLNKIEPERSYLNLSDWPVLEKESLRRSSLAFVSDQFNIQKLFKIQTSGTTGTPIKHYFDKESLSYWYALYEHRTRRWNDLFTDERWANIGGQLVTKISRRRAPFWVWNAPMKQLYLSSYHITEPNIKAYLGALRKYKIRYIVGYTSSIYNIAYDAIKNNWETPQMKLVITNAEPLFSYQREVIQRAFECKVIQTYGGSEAAFAANEDLEGTMYLWPEAGIIETLSPDGEILTESGAEGDFIVTGLVNKAMPLIRYKVGDSGSIIVNQGEYDRPYDVIKHITGRTDDLILTPDGRKVGRLDPVFKSDFPIKEAQIVQKTRKDLVVNIVPATGFGTKDQEQIHEALKQRLGIDMSIQINLKESIPRTKNGKFKAVISELNE